MLKKLFRKKSTTGPNHPPSDPAASCATSVALDRATLPDLPSGLTSESEPARLDNASQRNRRAWRERLASNALTRGLGSLFKHNPKLDESLLEELEILLITADVGIQATTELLEDLRQRMLKREFADATALRMRLRADLLAILKPIEQPLQPEPRQPFVILVVGVNGVGKTTTIGKLSHYFGAEGRQVMLAAGDTFRAAAVEQIRAWGKLNKVPVIAQDQGADAASVIYDALQSAQARKADILIVDTAGRLHTQAGLMDELAKIRRVLGKLDTTAPHEVLMIIDGTTGQNAINQVRQFNAMIGITGLTVTKLDGTAKGGVVFALAREFGLPIRYIGLGESSTDLRRFDAEAFVESLLPLNDHADFGP